VKPQVSRSCKSGVSAADSTRRARVRRTASCVIPDADEVVRVTCVLPWLQCIFMRSIMACSTRRR
jgi:hypothetical protein